MKLDEHKLIYHPERVTNWLMGGLIYPIYGEISLTSACNHRCIFCAPNFFLNYKAEYLDTDVIKMTLTSMADVGVKSVMFGGEGEPTLHKDFADIVKHAKESGLDVALTTNGTLFNDEIARKTLPHLSWIKFSLDSGSPSVYSKLHGTDRTDLKKVMDNIIQTVKLRDSCGYKTSIGGQAILFKENIDTIFPLAMFLKSAKANYLVIKPFSNHEKRLGDELELPTNEDIIKLKEKITPINTKDFKVIFRDIAFDNLEKPRTYYKCYAQDFMTYIDSLGGVHSCINYIDNKEFCYGNIYEDTFENIWKNKKEIKPNLNKCRSICRMDLINKYLWDLKNPINHVNFI